MASRRPNQLQETRHLIVKTAKSLFMQAGYRAVSTRQIADACGLTQPALYHHFSDKQELYVEVLRTFCATTQKALERIVRREHSIEECLYRTALYLIANHRDDLNMMFHDIRQELGAEAQTLIQRYWYDAYMQPVVSIFEAGQRSGRLRDSGQLGLDPVQSARLLLGLISQSLMPSSVPGIKAGSNGRRDWEQQARTLVRVLLYGLAEPDAGPAK